MIHEEEEDTGPLPPIFLSYQWGHQPHVKLLRRHLEAAGYRCWMDLGQMGGGDKLFAKIDTGMRAAAVIICCVTEKYAKSDNCNREVSYCNTTSPQTWYIHMVCRHNVTVAINVQILQGELLS